MAWVFVAPYLPAFPCVSPRSEEGMAAIDDFIEKFTTAVDFQEPVEITPDTVFAELAQWDSLAALGVIVMFDIEYGVTITGETLAAGKTIADLFALLG
jgi:acyl carrier protein